MLETWQHVPCADCGHQFTGDADPRKSLFFCPECGANINVHDAMLAHVMSTEGDIVVSPRLWGALMACFLEREPATHAAAHSMLFGRKLIAGPLGEDPDPRRIAEALYPEFNFPFTGPRAFSGVVVNADKPDVRKAFARPLPFWAAR